MMILKKIWQRLIEDFQSPYPNDPLLPSSLKDLGILILGGAVGLGLFALLYFSLCLFEGWLYGY